MTLDLGPRSLVRFLSALALATTIAACAGRVSSVEQAPDAATDTLRADTKFAEVSLPHPPKEHRPAATPCATPPLPPEPDFSHASFGPSAKIECNVHADCKAL